MSLIDRLKRRLTAVGKSERAASIDAGLSPTFIKDIFSGKTRSPGIDSLEKLAPVLETSPEWLAYGRGAEVSEAPPAGRERLARIWDRLAPEDIPAAEAMLEGLAKRSDEKKAK